MINYFKILEIEITNNEGIIKKAYGEMLRKHNAQKDVKKYDEINKARDFLMNKEKRAKLIINLNYGQSVEKLIEDGWISLRNKDYEGVEKILDKLKDLQTEEVLDLKGDFLYLKGKYAGALKIFDKLITMNPKQPIYVDRKNCCLINLKELDSIEQKIIQYIEDTGNIGRAFVEYLDSNINRKRFDKNKEIIIKLISKKNSKIDEYRKLLLISYNLKNSIYEGDYNNFKFKVESLMNKVKNIIKDKEEQKNIFYQLEDFVYILIELNRYKEMAILRLALCKETENLDYIEYKDDKKYMQYYLDVYNQYEMLLNSKNLSPRFFERLNIWLNQFKYSNNEEFLYELGKANHSLEKFLKENSQAKKEMEMVETYYRRAFEQIYVEPEEAKGEENDNEEEGNFLVNLFCGLLGMGFIYVVGAAVVSIGLMIIGGLFSLAIVTVKFLLFCFVGYYIINLLKNFWGKMY